MLPPRQCDPHTDLNMMLQPICHPCKRRLHVAQFPHRHKVVRPWSEGILKHCNLEFFLLGKEEDLIRKPQRHSQQALPPLPGFLSPWICSGISSLLSSQTLFISDRWLLSLPLPSQLFFPADLCSHLGHRDFPLVTMDWVLMKGNRQTRAFPLRQDF